MACSGTGEATKLLDLPYEILLHCVSFLSVRDIGRFSCCSHAVCEVLKDRYLWKQLYENRFGPQSGEGMWRTWDWRRAFYVRWTGSVDMDNPAAQAAMSVRLINKKGLEPGIAYLTEEGMIDGSSESIARFLRWGEGLSLDRKSEYLLRDEPMNRSVLAAYIGLFHFHHMTILAAIGALMTTLALPSDLLAIDRLVAVFTQHFIVCNTEYSEQGVYLLAFTAIVVCGPATDGARVINERSLTADETPEPAMVKFFNELMGKRAAGSTSVAEPIDTGELMAVFETIALFDIGPVATPRKSRETAESILASERERAMWIVARGPKKFREAVVVEACNRSWWPDLTQIMATASFHRQRVRFVIGNTDMQWYKESVIKVIVMRVVDAVLPTRPPTDEDRRFVREMTTLLTAILNKWRLPLTIEPRLREFIADNMVAIIGPNRQNVDEMIMALRAPHLEEFILDQMPSLVPKGGGRDVDLGDMMLWMTHPMRPAPPPPPPKKGLKKWMQDRKTKRPGEKEKDCCVQ